MPVSIKIEYINKVLHVLVLGNFSIDSAKATFIEMMHSLVKYRAEKVLVDCRLLKNMTQSAMTMYDYAENAANQLLNENLDPKLAYLLSPENFNEVTKFGENVAFNRGVHVKIFHDNDAALQWLAED